ncbi:alpha-ketoglutarate-dependent dioxygenase AlkB [Roseovarius sp. SCSIO 43702]|uniref:alpha-ketoglutarate-dependent dioxygenase AlkB family protein n=1 Tax=Roseovarius sp. SCSIO 43702 TaxID=2823043 RepID=UPI001C7317C8|nr:alpha-ketoglutarate-dependent dioxygenase AlkB [Roseovarius sp. SCSIO 43702]QYX57351.1 alpha-ketoglutarate-dependent dioxygenase AlkB [Roseovarius sp. SCSIO 43702]
MSRPAPTTTLAGFEIFEGYLDGPAQAALVDDLREVARRAPFFAPRTRFGKAMSVRMTSAGRYGWFTDARGYRYIDTHPEGTAWPPIPEGVLAVWCDLVGAARLPDCCLVNYYGEGARMGLHQDRDEADFDWPVLSISLGDEALFRVGGKDRRDPTRSIWLRSGDVVVMGGDARLAYHGIDRIKFGTSTLLPQGGRINLTLRVVD